MVSEKISYAKILFHTYRKILESYLLRFISRSKIERDKDFVFQEYQSRWNIASDINRNLNNKLRPAIFDGKIVLVKGIDHIKYYIKKISENVASIKPSTVLELGSGNGFNILSLAVLFPEVKSWQGLELTREGVNAANYFLRNPPLDDLAYVSELPRDIICERLKNARVNFIQGDMLCAPIQDKFDLVFTAASIEQIPNNYSQAFKEARRLSNRYALFMEEFNEVQKNIFERLHLINRDYFRASYKEVEWVGFTVLKLEPLKLKKLYFTYGLLLCKV